MSYTIRLAKPEDLSRILEIYKLAQQFMQETGNPHQWGTTYPAEALLQSDIAVQRLYVYEAQGQIGAVFYYWQGEDPTYRQIDGRWLNDAPYGTIHRIAVAVPGQGIAACCFRWALSQCPNLRIDTHADNLPMQTALRKFGFTHCGIIRLANGDPRMAYQIT